MTSIRSYDRTEVISEQGNECLSQEVSPYGKIVPFSQYQILINDFTVCICI